MIPASIIDNIKDRVRRMMNSNPLFIGSTDSNYASHILRSESISRSKYVCLHKRACIEK
jgi:hypothetical protein